MAGEMMQLGALDLRRSPADVRAAARQISPLDRRIQAGRNLTVLINQFNLEREHLERLRSRLQNESPRVRQAVASQFAELGQRLSGLRLRLAGLRGSYSQAVEQLRMKGYITNAEAEATGVYSTGLGLGPLAVVAVVAIVIGVAAVVGFFGPSWMQGFAAAVTETSKAQALRKWIDNELVRLAAADASGTVYTPAPPPPVLSIPTPSVSSNTGTALAGGGLLLAAAALFIIARKRRK